MTQYFTEENKQTNTQKEKISPSGKYKLVTTEYSTKPKCWNYSRGEVYKGDTKIADVLRNYSAFTYGWVENHPNGHDYLLCGEDYQGQTVIELDTQNRVNYLPKVAAQGCGFCMTEYSPSPNKDKLLICGCFWGGPYEYLLVDFSTPMNLPWKILDRFDESIDGDYNTIPIDYWSKDGMILQQMISHRKSDGKIWSELTTEEISEVCKSGDYYDKIYKCIIDINGNVTKSQIDD